jgi:hypothetical protein
MGKLSATLAAISMGAVLLPVVGLLTFLSVGAP